MSNLKCISKSLSVFLFLFAINTSLFADGKMYVHDERVPPTIPYQRAVIFFEDKLETLILQSKYEYTGNNNFDNMGWIVPVPAVPKLASTSLSSVNSIFSSLNLNTQPKVIRISSILFPASILISGVFSILSIYLLFNLEIHSKPKCLLNKKKILGWASVLGMFYCLLALTVAPAFSTAKSGDILNVDVLSESQEGIYDVQVVRSEKALDLVNWLQKNNFKYQEDDKRVFDFYLSQGWCFVVALVSQDRARNSIDHFSEGLSAPLILQFEIGNPIYPLALTATGGFDTEILLYLLSSRKMECDKKINLSSAGELWIGSQQLKYMLLHDEGLEGFFSKSTIDKFSYVCKFKELLSPKRMENDLVFYPAKNNEPYRKTVIKW